MRITRSMSCRLSGALIALGLCGLGGGAVGALAVEPESAAGAEEPSELFAAHHAKVHEHLSRIDRKARGIREASDARAEMEGVVRLLETHVRPHAEVEEANLYPVVDAYASPDAGRPFTASMRFEHRVVGSWIDELAEMAASSDADVDAFVRRAQRLLGLLEAHFLAEEEVLLPVLDEHMSVAEFRRRVMEPMGG